MGEWQADFFFCICFRAVAKRWLYHLEKITSLRENRLHMEYVVPLGILVAFMAWVVATFSRLYHLHRTAALAWAQWSRVTQHRNACLVDFTSVFSDYLPQGDMRPRNLRRLTDDSRRVLSSHADLPPDDDMHNLSRAEKALRAVVVSAVQVMENTAPMREDSRLNELSSQVSLCLFQQDELTRSYNRSVGNFNMALTAPGASLIASLFGFSPLPQIH